MAKCPSCNAGFEQPNLTKIKGGPKFSTLHPVMATCPGCDVVLRIFAV